MIIRRFALILALATLVPACGGSKVTNVYTTSTPGAGPSSPFTVIGAPAGTTGANESGGTADLGSDGLSRSVYVSGVSGSLQISFTRRNADGTWTTPLPISANNADFKDFVTTIVTGNNNFTHIFWLQGVTVAAYQLHYAQVTNDAAPILMVPDTIISTGPTLNALGTAAYGRVTTFTTAVDRTANNIFVLWIQAVLDGGSQTDVPIVASVLAGAGNLQERLALISPTGAASNHNSTDPVLRVAPATGRAHAVWAADVAGQTVRHRLRTALATWTSGPGGDAVSAVQGAVTSFPQLDAVLAPDGDLYVAWLNNIGEVRANRRPTGDGSVFGGEQLALNTPGFNKMIAVLEPGSEHFHIFYGFSGVGATTFVRAIRNPAANLAGAWESETIMSFSSVDASAVMDFAAFTDSSNRVTAILQAPAVPGDLPHTLARTRPSGAGNGNFGALRDLTATGPLPCIELKVVTNTQGNAIVAWRQGQDHVVPLGEIFGALYTSGGTFSSSFNISQTPGVGSHGPIFAFLKDSGTGYISWLEAVTSGPDTHDLYFALMP